MKVGKVKEVLSDYLDDSHVFSVLFLREEADEQIENWHGETQSELTDAEWENIVNLMSVDDGIWDELYASFNYYIEQTLKKREVKADVSSE